VLSIFGHNIVSTENDEWKRHRKVVAKAFNEPNNKLVWQETVDIVFELFALWEREGRANEVVVESVADLMREIALMVISAAGKYSIVNVDYSLELDREIYTNTH
jgi:cytochrome P450